MIGSDNEHGGLEATPHLIGSAAAGSPSSARSARLIPKFLDRYRGYVPRADEAEFRRGPACAPMPRRARPRAAPRWPRLLQRRGIDFDAIFAASPTSPRSARCRRSANGGKRVPETARRRFRRHRCRQLASPPLTTIAQDAAGSGEALVDSLIERIDGPGERAAATSPCALEMARGSSDGLPPAPRVEAVAGDHRIAERRAGSARRAGCRWHRPACRSAAGSPRRRRSRC